ncbi:MAG: signal peptidase I [Candidatus Nanohaloarchaeota archaeon QJJ-9]|nr:signal peptidase I [Candidatus Nanohaloarchaeota archaeon QJJ-9]
MMKNGFENDIFFVIVALVLAFGIYQSLGTALSTETPIVSVVSNSMKPTFQRGDLVVVKGEEFNRIKEEDIIVYKSKNDQVNLYMPPIIHRVVNKSNSSLSTKGDNNKYQVKACIDSRLEIKSECGPGEETIDLEENVTAEQIRGKAIFIVPKLGYPKILLTDFLNAVL